MKSNLLLGISLILLNCATSKATLDTYIDPGIDRIPIKRIAVFPIRNARFSQSEAVQVNRKVSVALKERNPGIEIMSANEAVTILNQYGLADDWGYFLDNYISSGIPDANVLADIGNALKIDAVLQGELLNIFQEDGAFGQNKGTTRVTVRFAMLSIKDAKTIWEASSDGIRVTATTLGGAPPVIEAVTLAIDKIIDSLPRYSR